MMVSPSRRRLIGICAMSATIMQAVDTTIANVALPHMQGSLSASLDQINWVLTSYIVASAIMTAPIAWLADRFGRKRLFIICAAGFTIASVLCGLSQNIEEIVLFRLLQGAFGAALIPLPQTMMLDLYEPHERAGAMAVWGIGVMLGPIMGPTFGAWLTEHYSWHWVFFINVPFGIFTVIGLSILMPETELKRDRPFDWFGFAAFAAAIGCLQLMLDRGEQLGWFSSPEIIAYGLAALAAAYYFLAHSFTATKPFVRLELFKDRNFVAACFFMLVIGVVILGTMALVTPYMQGVHGYPILTAGALLAARGAGTLVAMTIVGRLMRTIEARYLVLIGFGLCAVTLYHMIGFTEHTPGPAIMWTSAVQGFGVGFVFVPLSTAAFTSLAAHLRTEGSAMLTLLRSVGSSVGISIVIAQLTSGTTRAHATLAEAVTPFNDALQAPDIAGVLSPGSSTGLAGLEQMVTLQASVIAYGNAFAFLFVLTVAALPLVFFIGPTRVPLPVTAPGPAPVPSTR